VIIALEGPDRCGKTTLFNALKKELRDTAFVPSLPYGKELLPVMQYMEARAEALWRALYDPSRVYVCDRCFAFSNVVYGALYGREQLCDVSGWLPELRILYIDVPLKELERRYAEVGDDMFDAARYKDVLNLYEKFLPEYEHVRLDGTSNELVRNAVEAVVCWRSCSWNTADAG